MNVDAASDVDKCRDNEGVRSPRSRTFAIVAASQDALDIMSRKRKQVHTSRLTELENLSKTVQQEEAISLEERQRQMGIIYSRRKRVRHNQRIDGLTETCVSYRECNEYLSEENKRLEGLLEQASKIAEMVVSSSDGSNASQGALLADTASSISTNSLQIPAGRDAYTDHSLPSRPFLPPPGILPAGEHLNAWNLSQLHQRVTLGQLRADPFSNPNSISWSDTTRRHQQQSMSLGLDGYAEGIACGRQALPFEASSLPLCPVG